MLDFDQKISQEDVNSVTKSVLLGLILIKYVSLANLKEGIKILPIQEDKPEPIDLDKKLEQQLEELKKRLIA